MRLIYGLMSLAALCLAVIGSTISSITSTLFALVPRLIEPRPFALHSNPRSIFETRRMGLA